MHSRDCQNVTFHYNGGMTSGEVIVFVKNIHNTIELQSEDLIEVAKRYEEENETRDVFNGKEHDYYFQKNFSGNILITNRTTNQTVSFPAKEILKLVAFAYVQSREISRIEGMDWNELIKLI